MYIPMCVTVQSRPTCWYHSCPKWGDMSFHPILSESFYVKFHHTHGTVLLLHITWKIILAMISSPLALWNLTLYSRRSRQTTQWRSIKWQRFVWYVKITALPDNSFPYNNFEIWFRCFLSQVEDTYIQRGCVQTLFLSYLIEIMKLAWKMSHDITPVIYKFCCVFHYQIWLILGPALISAVIFIIKTRFNPNIQDGRQPLSLML